MNLLGFLVRINFFSLQVRRSFEKSDIFKLIKVLKSSEGKQPQGCVNSDLVLHPFLNSHEGF